MIDLYYWPTPNGHKITLFLEETGLPYRIHPVNIGKGEQFNPDFLKIAPNNRIPAIVDQDPAGGGTPISLFESGAILLYLAEKTGKFIPAEIRGRAEVLQWLFWQMGGLGPMAGQNGHFTIYAPEKIPYAIERYTRETRAALRRDGPAPRRPRLSRWRLFDRRHGLLSLGRAARDAQAEHPRLSRISSAGSTPSPRARPPGAPMRWRRPRGRR